MKLTQRQQDQRLSPHRVNQRWFRWFYLREGRGGNACSFHADNGGCIDNIPVTALLRALDRCGYLDQWDRKQQTLKQVQP
jgi:hypothetical protein